ncbi:putative ABC transporter ATP-binding protein [Dictyobacter arantiisoli]|uniref:Putative ABC transporter ATP-binding protein n=2 Tax=Dictyobacter arantiisoli TaxID=2014874 RepID=A0A5A5T6X9_9CHLR|nr:putative ABC transporter ATP-binding protein [Dictyobacter arantiisoli]
MQYPIQEQSNTVPQAQAVVEARNVSRTFRSGDTVIQVLRDINLTIQSGEFVTLQGRSGSGKSTLFNILVGLDNPTQGEVAILGQSLQPLNEAKRATLRREKVGLLFQNAHLVPVLTARENVEIALRMLLVPARERSTLSQEVLERVGLKDKMEHRGMELSGGEQQRVALARALVHRPRFLIADEPTGNLDSMTARNIILLLRDIVTQTGVGLLVATHDRNVVSAAHRTVNIHDGALA